MDVIERELKVIASEESTSAVEEWYEGFRNIETRARIRASLGWLGCEAEILVTIKSSAVGLANFA